jgi:hypothetical protein
MKIKHAVVTGILAASSLMCVAAFADTTTNANASGTNTNTSGSTASNDGLNTGNSLTNNFLSPSDTDVHEHLSGITGSNTAVGLGSFSSSFSSDYCGGVAQAGVSVPYVTGALGHPVLGEPGVPCVDTRAAVHTMEFSATYGNAAHAAQAVADERAKELQAIENKIKNPASGADAIAAAGSVADIQNQYTAAEARAQAFADTSAKLATAAINMLCSVSDDVKKAYNDAGIDCKGTPPPAK